jgi:hypothetical protein
VGLAPSVIRCSPASFSLLAVDAKVDVLAS